MPDASREPKCIEDIADRIVHYGHFKDGLDFLTNFMSSPYSSSLILIGDIGTGKKSLIREAELASDVVTIRLNPYHQPDDFSTIKRVASKLGIGKRATTIQEVLEDLEERSGITKKKIVIVLSEFQEFCRQKQSLLYNLTTLTQHGHNISLIGTTHSIDCTANLEKRVRSRINAQSYILRYPYENPKQYVEFASQLLGGQKITGRLKDQLEHMFRCGNYTIYSLKRYLISMCSWDQDGNLDVNQHHGDLFDPKNDMPNLHQRAADLTKAQVELLKVVCCYCYQKKTYKFSPNDLREFALNHQLNNFETTGERANRDFAQLNSTCFLRVAKPNEMQTQSSVFTLNIAPIHMRAIIEARLDLQTLKTNALWKKLPRLANYGPAKERAAESKLEDLQEDINWGSS